MLWAKIPPEEVEKVVAQILQKSGFSDVKIVGGPNDTGIDIICYRDDPITGREKVIVQVKRRTSKSGLNEIQTFHMIMNREKATRGIYVSTSGFTKSAVDYVENYAPNIVLWDGLKLDEFVEKFGIHVEVPKEKTKISPFESLEEKRETEPPERPKIKTHCLGRYVLGDVEEYIELIKERVGIDDDPLEIHVHLSESYLLDLKYYYMGYDSAGRRRKLTSKETVLVMNNGIFKPNTTTLMKCFHATDYTIDEKITLPTVERHLRKNYPVGYKILQKDKIYTINRIEVLFSAGLGKILAKFYANGKIKTYIQPPDPEKVKHHLEQKYGMKIKTFKKEYAELTNGEVLIKLRLNELGTVEKEERIYLDKYFESKIGGTVVAKQKNIILVKKNESYSYYEINRKTGNYNYLGDLISLEEAESQLREKYKEMDFKIVRTDLIFDGWKIEVAGDLSGYAIIGNDSTEYHIIVSKEYIKRKYSNYGKIFDLEFKDDVYTLHAEDDSWKYTVEIDAQTGKKISEKKKLKFERAHQIAKDYLKEKYTLASITFSGEKSNKYVFEFVTEKYEGVLLVNSLNGTVMLQSKKYNKNYIEQYFRKKFGSKIERIDTRKKSIRVLVVDNGEYIYMKFDRNTLQKTSEDRVSTKGFLSKLKKKTLDVKYFG